MGRGRSLGAEVFFGLDESAPKVAHPGAVDGDAGGERVGGVDEPLGEVESVAAGGGLGKGGLYLGKDAGGEFADLLVGTGEVTASEDEGGAGLGEFTHDHEFSGAGHGCGGLLALRHGRGGGGESDGEASHEVVVVEVVLHADREGFALGWNWFFEEEDGLVFGVHLGLLAAAGVDGPAGVLVPVDDCGGGEAGLFVIGERGGETDRFAVDGDTEVGEDEVAITGGARAVLGEGLIGEDAQAEGGDGLEVGCDG